MLRGNESGFSLVELLVGAAIASLVVGLLSAATFQFLNATARGHDKLAVVRDHGTAFQWLNRDAQNAVAAQATVLPASVTLDWTDAVSGSAYQVSYAQSGNDLVRALTVDGTPSSQVVARNLDVGGFAASLTGALLTVSITSSRGGVTETRSESTLLRAAGAVSLSPMRLVTGSYTGDGSNGRQIIGAGFQPDVVIIKSEGARAAVVRTSTMVGDAAKVVDSVGSLQANLIESLDADGFTIGSDRDVSQSGETFHWVAMKVGSDLTVGSYVGDGSDNRSISGLGLQPVWVITLGDGEFSVYRPGSVSGDNSYRINDIVAGSNNIQALEADGFQVGSASNVNRSGTTFHYIAWAASSQVVQSGYTGDGNDDRSITGVGFQPQIVWLKRYSVSWPVWRAASVNGDSSLYWRAGIAASNRIQGLEPDGFQLGDDNEVNKNNQTYHYLALRDGGP